MKTALAKAASTFNFDLLSRWLGNYDKEEKVLLARIQQIYLNATKESFYWHLPQTEAPADGKPIHILRFQLDYNHWNKKLGTNPLLEIIEEMFAQICSYQKLRLDTLRSKLTSMGCVDRLNDPISLMLEEIKAWLERKVTTYDLLNESSCTELIEAIGVRSNYFDALMQGGFLSCF